MQTSIWGPVSLQLQLTQELWYIQTEKNAGLVMPIEKWDSLSLTLQQMAESDDSYLYFSQPEVVLAGLIQQRYELLDVLQRELAEYLAAQRWVERYGQCRKALGDTKAAEYPVSRGDRRKKLCEGVYLLYCQEVLGLRRLSGLAVHKKIAHACLTQVACAFAAQRKKEYLYFDEVSCAIPLYEMMALPEIKQILAGEENLIGQINLAFASYRHAYNLQALPGRQLPAYPPEPEGAFLKEEYLSMKQDKK